MDKQNWRVIYLASGDQLIVTDVRPSVFSANHLVLINPMRVAIYSAEDHYSVAMFKWIPFSDDDEVMVTLSNVLTICKLNPESEAYFENALNVASKSKTRFLRSALDQAEQQDDQEEDEETSIQVHPEETKVVDSSKLKNLIQRFKHKLSTEDTTEK